MKKQLILLMVLFLSLFIRAQEVLIDPVETMPVFPGSELEMNQFIKENLYYPWANDSVKGQVHTLFIINQEGNTTKVEIKQGLNPLADTIAANIIRKMPQWKPSELDGLPVCSRYVLPIPFNPNDIEKDKKLNTSDTTPTFPGGEEAMYKFIADNFKYHNPNLNIQGKIVARFIIDSSGKIHYPHILKSVHPTFDKEVLRVIKLMPNFIIQKKGSVGCYLFTLPIIFKIEEDQLF
ncbi:MAG: hypothetical protein GX905_00040 [Bacteroidales bacterium]|nr:hypothetical protein [Bacteroidales bacterium]